MNLGLNGRSVLVTGGSKGIGRVAHVLVNNAGDIPGGTLESMNEERWRHAWELKVFGYINLCRFIYARMKARRSGVIVNLIGIAAEHPSSTSAAARATRASPPSPRRSVKG